MQIKNAGVGRHLFYVLQISQSAKRGSDLMLVTDKQGRLQHVTQVCSCLHRPPDPIIQGLPRKATHRVTGIGNLHGPADVFQTYHGVLVNPLLHIL
jgi:hypothetical protein